MLTINIDAFGRQLHSISLGEGSGDYGNGNSYLPQDDLFYSAQWQVLEDNRVYDCYTQSQYVWSPTYVNDLVLRDRSTAGNATFNERIYVQHDANHNVTALTDTSGAVLERFDYDPAPYGYISR